MSPARLFGVRVATPYFGSAIFHRDQINNLGKKRGNCGRKTNFMYYTLFNATRCLFLIKTVLPFLRIVMANNIYIFL